MPAMEGARYFFSAEHGTEGKAAGEGLGQGSDVGLDSVMLIGAPLAGAAHAGLNFIDDEQRAGGTGEGAGFSEEFLREGTDAAFTLDGFDEDGADFSGEFGAQIGYVVEANEFNAGDDRSEGLAVFLLICGRDCAEGAAMKALLEGEELCAEGDAFAALEAGIGTGQLHGALPSFSAGVSRRRRGRGRFAR